MSEQLTESLGYDVPLLAQLPLEPELRETGEAGRPAVLNEDGALRADGIGETFRNLAESLMHRPCDVRGTYPGRHDLRYGQWPNAAADSQLIRGTSGWKTKRNEMTLVKILCLV